jgi:hypothetical protein
MPSKLAGCALLPLSVLTPSSSSSAAGFIAWSTEAISSA